jgi:hypothetical protein
MISDSFPYSEGKNHEFYELFLSRILHCPLNIGLDSPKDIALRSVRKYRIWILPRNPTESLRCIPNFIGARLRECFAREKVVQDGEIFERPLYFLEEGGAILDYVADDMLR